jgi:hypothetical protein
MQKKTSSILIFIFLFGNFSVFSQSIESLLSKYTEDNGEKFMQPLADAFGANINSGLFHSAKVKKMGFQIYVGFSASMTFIPESKKYFNGTTEGLFSPQQSAKVPTVFGPTQTVSVNGDGGTTYTFPGGLNMKMLPYAIPQLTIGSVYGTDVTFRFFSMKLGDDIGKLNVFGIGLRHNLNQYLENLPLDLAGGIYYQSFKLGDIVKAHSILISAQASKRILIFTFYGGLGYENTQLNLEYTLEQDNSNISFKLKGKDNFRITTGIAFNMGPVKLNTDYNYAGQSIINIGVGVGFGD